MINNQFIYPHWPAPSKVHALSTRRAGGVSAGRYDSFNLAQHVGDNPVQVAHNRQILIDQASLPTAPHWLNQTHSTQVIEITQEHAVDNNTDQAPIDADGVVSHHSNVVCSVLTADCMPILLTNQQGSSVAAVHAGWRGLANGILENAIAAMNCPPEQIIAWAGPCIGSQAFEVGLEVRDQLGGPDSAYQSISDDKVYADLVSLAQFRLQTVGVNEFSASHACTYENENEFFSYRRSGQCGRMASLIWMEPS